MGCSTFWRRRSGGPIYPELEQNVGGVVVYYAKNQKQGLLQAVREQISSQLSTHVLQGVRFGVLHNDVRYPRYLDRKRSCLLLELSENDSATVRKCLPD